METGPAARAWAGPRPKSPSGPALPTSAPPAARPLEPRWGPLVRLLERGCWAFPNVCSSQCVDPLPRLAVQGPQVEKHRHIAVEAAPWQCPRPTAIASLQTTGPRVHKVQQLKHMDFSSCGPWALEHGLNSCGA